jgi:hypothetical protein
MLERMQFTGGLGSAVSVNAKPSGTLPYGISRKESLYGHFATPFVANQRHLLRMNWEKEI